MSEETCRIDVWLWRARFFKTRALACRFVEAGRLRLTRHGKETRVEKPAQSVKVGDALMFVLGGRVIALSVVAPGERRGPPAEARALYMPLDAPPDRPGATASTEANAQQR